MVSYFFLHLVPIYRYCILVSFQNHAAFRADLFNSFYKTDGKSNKMCEKTKRLVNEKSTYIRLTFTWEIVKTIIIFYFIIGFTMFDCSKRNCKNNDSFSCTSPECYWSVMTSLMVTVKEKFLMHIKACMLNVLLEFLITPVTLKTKPN